jgi:hypothetical protein
MFTAVSVTVSNFLTKLGGVVFRANKSRELEEKLDQYVTAKADGIVKETLMTLSGKDKKSFLGEIKPLNSLKDSNLSSSDSSSSLASVGTFPASDKQNKQASSKEPSDLIPKLSIGYIGY